MKKVIFSMLALFCAAFAFTSCEDVPMPYDQPGEGGEDPVVVEPTGDGTAENPYNVAAALQYIESLGADVESPVDIYIKGKVVTVTEEYSTNFGNGTFYISDDGTNKNQFYVYRAMYLGNKKFANGNTQIQEGDEVIICGRVVNYKGTTPETAQNKSFLYSLNGETAGGGGASGTPKGKGTLDDPYNPAGVIAYINTLGSDVESPVDVYVKGKIGSVTEEYSTNFGNGTFTIVEEGAEGTAFTVYRALYLGNKKFANGDTQIKEGDEVIVCGKVINYRGNTPETQQNKAYLYSLNGKTAGGGDTPQPGEAKGSGTLDDPFNPVAANNYATSLGSDVKSDKDVYVKGKISRVAEKYGTQFGNATFYISEDGSQSNEFYVFRALYLNNEKYASGDNINVGDEVIVCGKVVNYKGNTPETVQNEAYLYSLNSAGGGGGGGETTGNVTKTVDGSNVILVVANTTEGDKITVDLSAQGWESGKAVDPATITLSDGTKITFAKGEGSNTPAFYEATKGVRVYAKNTITISGKAVAKVVMTCDSYNGTAYTGNSTLYASASGTTFTICNEHSEAKGGDQLRVQTIEITYAK